MSFASARMPPSCSGTKEEERSGDLERDKKGNLGAGKTNSAAFKTKHFQNLCTNSL